MPPIRLPRPSRVPLALGISLVLCTAGGAWLLRGAPSLAEDASAMHAHAGHAMEGHAMDDRAMERWVRDWYAAHPARGGVVTAAGAPADTFLATGTRFDADHNAGTQVDNVHIFAGQSILWQWVDGSHTTTSGTGAADPNAGVLWDVPLTSVAPQFTRAFPTTGTFPFFCRPHEGFGMKGIVTVAAPADTFLAAGTSFDTDGNVATQVDTAIITVGSAVMWRDVSGSHTVTSGTGSTDPTAGQRFDVPLSTAGATFTFVFKSQGTFPFFCRPHEGFNMRGVVRVTAPLDVPPIAGRPTRGFAGEPWPSPTRGGVSFQFALVEPGHVRAEVFDAAGRRVAVIASGSYPAGVFPARWDGRAGGNRTPGVYYMRLEVPGFTGTRSVVVVP